MSRVYVKLNNSGTRWVINGQSMGQANASLFTGKLVSDAVEYNADGSVAIDAEGMPIPDMSKRITLPSGYVLDPTKVTLVGLNGEGNTESAFQETTGMSFAQFYDKGVGLVYARVGNIFSDAMQGDLVSPLLPYPLPTGAGVAQLPADVAANTSISGYHSIHTGLFPAILEAITNPSRVLITDHQTFSPEWTINFARWVATLGDLNPAIAGTPESYIRTAILGVAASVVGVPGDAGNTIGSALGQELFDSPSLGKLFGWGFELAMKVYAFQNPVALLKTIVTGLGLASLLDPGQPDATALLDKATQLYGSTPPDAVRSVFTINGNKEPFIVQTFDSGNVLYADFQGNTRSYEFDTGLSTLTTKTGIQVLRDSTGVGYVAWDDGNGQSYVPIVSGDMVLLQPDGSMVVRHINANGGYTDSITRQDRALVKGVVDATGRKYTFTASNGDSHTIPLGAVATSSVTTAGQLTMTVERQIDGHQVKVEFIEDEWGELQASRVVSVDGQAIDGDSAFDDLLNYQGYDAWGFADGATPTGSAPLEALFNAYDPLKKQGLQTLVTALTRTADALSLLSAIQSGKPLPILASGLRLANAIPGAANDAARAGFNLSGVSNAVSGVLSLMSLDQALKNGDAIGAITAGAQALSFGASAWVDFAAQNVLTATTFEATAAAHVAFDGAVGFQQGVGKALPALNIINSLAHGDYVGAGINTLAALNPITFGPLAIAYTVFSLIKGLFGGDDPEPWASGRWGWNGQGQPVPLVAGGDGGEATLTHLMNQLQGILTQLAGQEGNGLGLIPERLPGLSFRDNTYHLTDLDYASGAENLPGLRYTTAGQPYNAPAGSEEGYWSLAERFVRVALEHGAIAPQWEADTARLQTQNHLNDAGLTEEDRAAKANKLAAPATGTSQAFRPVVLDLDGDGIQVTAKDSSGVAFDVDDSGFLKATGWLADEGANTDGYLWLDRGLHPSPYGRITRTFLHSCPIRAANDPPHRMAA